VAMVQDEVNGAGSKESPATIDFATTLHRRLLASLDVAVLTNQTTAPARVGVWSPWTGSGYFVAFGPAPANAIDFEAITGGEPGADLVGGQVTSTQVGRYEL